MDIAGAKALKERLGLSGADYAPRVPAAVSEDAPPVYQWLGVSQSEPDASTKDGEDEPGGSTASLFRWVGFNSR